MREIKEYKGSRQALQHPLNKNSRMREHRKCRIKMIKLQKNITSVILRNYFLIYKELTDYQIEWDKKT